MNNTPKATETRKIPIPEWVRSIPGVTEDMFSRERYEPSGGWTWYDYYAENIIPIIDGTIDNAKKFLDEAAQRDAVMACFRKQIASSKSTISEIERLANNANMSLGSLGETYNMWVKATHELERSFGLCEEEKPNEDIKAATNDISALTVLKEYILIDRDIDIALHALHLIDTRYRIKLFRNILKQVKQLETRLNMIRTTQSHIIALLNEHTCVGDFMKTLDDAYQVLIPSMRKWKKLVDQRGAEALEDSIEINHIKRPAIMDLAS